MAKRARRLVFTGAPGSGKTTLLRALELQGFIVVEEAATDVIALDQGKGLEAPWREASFIDKILDLQTLRARRVAKLSQTVLFDRSPFCTLALARHLGVVVPKGLLQTLDLLVKQERFDPSVVFVRSLDFITATAARTLSLDEARQFGATHREVYQHYGFTLIDIPPAPLEQRVKMVVDACRLSPPIR